MPCEFLRLPSDSKTIYLSAFIAWPYCQVTTFALHRHEDRGVFGKHGATRQQFHHKSDSGSVRSQSQTRSADLVTSSNHYAAYPGLVPFVSAEPGLYPICLPPFVFFYSPTDCCHRKTLRRPVLNRGLGAVRPRPERTPLPNGQ